MWFEQLQGTEEKKAQRKNGKGKRGSGGRNSLAHNGELESTEQYLMSKTMENLRRKTRTHVKKKGKEKRACSVRKIYARGQRVECEGL